MYAVAYALHCDLRWQRVDPAVAYPRAAGAEGAVLGDSHHA